MNYNFKVDLRIVFLLDSEELSKSGKLFLKQGVLDKILQRHLFWPITHILSLKRLTQYWSPLLSFGILVIKILNDTLRQHLKLLITIVDEKIIWSE